MQIKFIKYAWILCITFIILIPLNMQAQNNSQWFSWGQAKVLPVKEGLSNTITGISNAALIVAGGSNFDQPIQQGGKKQVHDLIYVAADDNSMNWMVAGKLPVPLTNAAVVALNDGLLVIGGTDGIHASDQVFLLRWNPYSKKIETDSAYTRLPVPLSSLSAARVGGTIYIAGGQDSQQKPQQSFWKLEPGQDGSFAGQQWQPMPAWPGVARFGAAMLAQSNGEYDCLYLLGGKGTTGYLKDAFCYDRRKNKWTILADLPRPALFSAFIALGQTHIALFSGSDGHDVDKAIAMKDDYQMVKDVLAYHTITNTWIKLDDIPTGVAGATAVKWNNKLMLIGGELRPGLRSSQIQMAAVQTAKQKSKFGWIDYTTLVLYLVVLAMISYYFSQKKAADDYLLGSKNIPYWAAGISIMATQVSAIGFMSIPAKAYAVNWAYFGGVFTWFVAVPIVTRAYIPFIRKLNVASAYHYLEERFSSGARMFAAAVFVFYQLARMGLVLYLPALALAAVTPLDTLTCILIMGVLSTAYTVMGGIEAVIWIEVVQAILLFGGAVICIVLAIAGLKGGLSDFFTQGIADQKFSLGQADWDFTSSSLVVILIGNIFIRLGNLTSDQAVVQRYMTTSSLKQARRSVWMDVIVSIPWAIVIYGLGTALYIYYKQHPAALNPSITTDGILPMFIAQNAPFGLSGLIIAGIFAASMSTLEGHIHSVATIFTTDFYGKFKKNISQKETAFVAKVTTIAIGVFATGLSVILIFIDVNSILDVFQEITGLFIGASTAMFLLGIFTRRANATGALIGAVSSGFILYFIKTFTPLSFWLYSAIGFLSCYLIGYLASCLFKGKKELQGLTYYTINDNLKETINDLQITHEQK